MNSSIRKQVEEELLANYQKYYRLAYSYVRNEADALDIVQESAYKAIKNCSGIREEAVIATWIYRIVINTSFDVLRNARKNQGTAEQIEQEEAEEEQGYARSDIMETLSTLEDKDRNILILRYFECFPLGQIAQITGENLNTVKSRLYRALNKLRLRLE